MNNNAETPATGSNDMHMIPALKDCPFCRKPDFLEIFTLTTERPDGKELVCDAVKCNRCEAEAPLSVWQGGTIAHANNLHELTTTMDNNAVTPATGSNDLTMIPLTVDGVKACLIAIKDGSIESPGYKGSSSPVDIVIRNAGFDVREATIKHELKRLNHSDPSPGAGKRELEAELEAFNARRRLAAIFDILAQAAIPREKFSKNFEALKHIVAEQRQLASELEIGITCLREKDVREEVEKLAALESQLAEINASLSETTQTVETICKEWLKTEEQFSELFEIVVISALSVVEVYQISSATIRPALPADSANSAA